MSYQKIMNDIEEQNIIQKIKLLDPSAYEKMELDKLEKQVADLRKITTKHIDDSDTIRVRINELDKFIDIFLETEWNKLHETFKLLSLVLLAIAFNHIDE